MEKLSLTDLHHRHKIPWHLACSLLHFSVFPRPHFHRVFLFCFVLSRLLIPQLSTTLDVVLGLAGSASPGGAGGVTLKSRITNLLQQKQDVGGQNSPGSFPGWSTLRTSCLR